LQQLQRSAVTGRTQGAHQLSVKARHARFKLLNVLHDLSEDKAMRRCDLLGLQGLKDVLPAGTQALAGQTQHLGHAFARNQCLDHGACRLAVQV